MKYSLEETTLKSMGDALRSVTGETDTYTPLEMIDTISNLSKDSVMGIAVNTSTIQQINNITSDGANRYFLWSPKKMTDRGSLDISDLLTDTTQYILMLHDYHFVRNYTYNVIDGRAEVYYQTENGGITTSMFDIEDAVDGGEWMLDPNFLVFDSGDYFIGLSVNSI